MSFLTTDLYDANEGKVAVLQPMLKSYGGKARFAGQIVTLKLYEDNTLVREVLGEAGAGYILLTMASIAPESIQQFAEEIELHAARGHAEREVGDRQHPGVPAFAETRESDAAAADPARQGVVLHPQRVEAGEQAVGAAGDAADPAVRAVGPVGETGLFGEQPGLVGETRAQAARVALLQPDHVEGTGELGDGAQVAGLARGEHMAPAAGEVVAVGAGAVPGLDVAAQQPERPWRHPPRPGGFSGRRAPGPPAAWKSSM